MRINSIIYIPYCVCGFVRYIQYVIFAVKADKIVLNVKKARNGRAELVPFFFITHGQLKENVAHLALVCGYQKY